MSFKYKQSTGEMFYPDGSLLALGYSGAGEGKNNPAMQNVAKVGPIPEGRYEIILIRDGSGALCDYKGKKAPVLHLMPQEGNQMFGRAGFLIHGDSVGAPGTASEGCIILPHGARVLMARMVNERDDVLQVIA